MNKIATLVVLLGLSAQPALAISVNTGVDSSVKAGSGASVNTKVESNESTSSEDEAESNEMIEVNTDPIVITSSDVDETEVNVSSTAAVNSEAELNSYARGVVKANADIRDVILSDAEVSVSHREHARLFGIVPIKVFARAYVKSDGRVKVKFPWYAFASAKKAAIESRVAAAVSTSLSAQADLSLSAQTQAKVLEKTVAAMKAEFEAEASANTKVR